MTVTFTKSDVLADLSDDYATRIAVHFDYDRDDVAAIKRVPGRKFVSKDKTDGEPHWTVPKDLMSARALRAEFGDRLKLSQRLKDWGFAAARQDKMLGSLGAADDAELELLPEVLPTIADAVRGYQRAGIKFLSLNGGLIADQPGLGKTLQAIGALGEAGLMDDSNRGFLVVASPAISVSSTWRKELAKWQDFEVFLAVGSRDERREVIAAYEDCIAFGGTAFLVVNPDMVRLGRVYETDQCIFHDDKDSAGDKRKCDFCITREVREYEQFNDLTFDAIIVDESHESIRNPSTLTARGIYDLNESDDAIKIAMTGTPIMNRPIDLWAVLHWLNPEAFSSKWRWAERFCEIDDNGYGKTIGDLREDTQEEFFESLKPYVLRRTKKEVAKDLPQKNHMPIELGFASASHEKQYRQFQAEAYMKIADMELTATGVLDELTRLRQFAIAECTVEANPKGDDHPILVRHTNNSAKIEWLDEQIEELGITNGGKPNGGTDKIVVFSQFVTVCEMVKKHYEDKGLKVGMITGGVSIKKREAAIDEFQNRDSDMKIMVVSTKAGGASIELDAADTVVFMDETWNHARMEQAEDRVHRANKGRTRPVNIYILRTEDTVETNTVAPKVAGKKAMSDFILDVRRGIMES